MATFYHVTHNRLLTSITTRGVDPQFSRGRAKTCWYCGERQVFAVLYHVARRDDADVDDLRVVKVDVPRSIMRRSRWPGMWYTPNHVDATSIRGVLRPVKWLAEEAEHTDSE